MMFQMSNRELEKALVQLDKISENKTVLPVKVSYKIVKNIIEIRRAVESYFICKDKIIEKYSDGKGSLTESDDPESFKKACSEIALIANEKVDVDISTIWIGEFGNEPLPFDMISALGFMIEDNT